MLTRRRRPSIRPAACTTRDATAPAVSASSTIRSWPSCACAGRAGACSTSISTPITPTAWRRRSATMPAC
ncbi:MAG: hypothetical protein MZW92_49925 [Comamonadaceae bacterium]|nr:hypothetical protein [Comamonadaceae bacterium]